MIARRYINRMDLDSGNSPNCHGLKAVAIHGFSSNRISLARSVSFSKM